MNDYTPEMRRLLQEVITSGALGDGDEALRLDDEIRALLLRVDEPRTTQEIDRLAAAVRQAHPTTSIPDDVLLLLVQVAQDARHLLACNCMAPACDGTCTHGMATRALAALQAYQTGGAQ